MEKSGVTKILGFALSLALFVYAGYTGYTYYRDYRLQNKPIVYESFKSEAHKLTMQIPKGWQDSGTKGPGLLFSKMDERRWRFVNLFSYPLPAVNNKVTVDGVCGSRSWRNSKGSA